MARSQPRARRPAWPGCAAALLLWAAAAPAAEAPHPAADEGLPPGEVPIDLQADKLAYDSKAGVLLLEGHVIADRAGARLRAARGRLDRVKGELLLSGGVLAVQGNQAVIADAARIDLRSRRADLDGAVLFVKDGPLDALTIDEPGKARAAGQNQLTARAARVEQVPGGGLILRQVIATPCNCAAQPDYEIWSELARVADDRAKLESPRLHLLGGSLPLFPLSLPLLDRQSGMLAPQLGFSQTTGLSVAQPVYLVIDRSWDLTLTPGLYSGKVGGSTPALGQRSIAGPRLGAELRGAPVEGSRGELALDLIQDLAAGQSPGAGPPYPGERGASAGRGLFGLRGLARFNERTEGGAWTFAVEGALATDSTILADTQPPQVVTTDVLRTDVGLRRASGPLSLGASATGLQDLRIADGGLPDRRLFGAEARPTPQRLPSPFLQLAPVALGPLTLAVDASALAVAAFARSPREAATGFGPTDLGAASATATDPAGADLGRTPTLRFDLAPRASVALPPGFPLRGRLVAGARADAWLFPSQSERDTRRLQAFAEAEAAVTLARPFGDWAHSIEPEARLRAIGPALLGGGPPIGDPADAGGLRWSAAPAQAEQGGAAGLARDASPSGALFTQGVPASRRPLDEVDGAAASTGAVEASVAVRQTLWRRAGPGGPPTAAVRVLLQQDLVLSDGAGGTRAADAVAGLGLNLDPFSLTGEARYDWLTASLSLASAGAQVHDARGDTLALSAIAQRPGVADRARAGVDELFASTRLAALPGALTGTLGVSAAWVLPTEARGLSLSYAFTWRSGDLPAGTANLVHSATFAWRPPCGCAALGVGLDLGFAQVDGAEQLQTPGFRFTFELKSLGR